MATIAAQAADTFVDKIGVQVHSAFGASDRPDNTNVYNRLAWVDALTWLGIRHVRDQVWTPSVSGASGVQCQAAALALQAAGIGVLRSVTGPSKLAELMNGELPAPEAVEPYNERDGSSASWVADITSFQPTLYSTVKAAWPSVPVLGAALAHQYNYANIGSLAPNVDANNLHNYSTPAQTVEYVPATVNTNLNTFRTQGPGLPLWLTETGLSHGDPLVPGVDVGEFTAAKLLPRIALYAITPTTVSTVNCYPKYTGSGGMGAARVYLYELLDEHSVLTLSPPIEDRYGLFTAALKPKLSAFVLRTFLTLLADPGATVTLGSLNVSFTGTPANQLNQVVYQKSDGSYWWLVWQPNQVSNFETGGGGTPNGGPDLDDAGVALSVTFGSSWPSIEVFRPLVSAAPIAHTAGTTLALQAYTDIQLVRLGTSPFQQPVGQYGSPPIRPN